MERPRPGDLIECTKDRGNVTNSPWTSEIISVEKEDHYRVKYDNGYELYHIPWKHFVDSWKSQSGKKIYGVS